MSQHDFRTTITTTIVIQLLNSSNSFNIFFSTAVHPIQI